MKKLVKVFFALSLGLLIAACAKEYDDTALKNDVKTLQEQVKKIQEDLNNLNSQVSGLATVIEQWKKGGYVESIQETADKDGYTITFVGGKTVTLYHGTDGEDGEDGEPGAPGDPGQDGEPGQDGKTPTIKMDEDNNYYWAIEDEFILVDGNKVPATMAPSFSINEDGDLIMTLAGEEINLGHITGDAGDAFFKEIDASGDVVVFVLNDEEETTFEIPFAKCFSIALEADSFQIEANETLNIPFEVLNANESTTVDCFANGGYKAEIQDDQLIVTAPAQMADGQVLLWATNDQNLISLMKISFTCLANAEIVIAEAQVEALQAIAAETTNANVSITSNVDVDVVVPQAASNWISVTVTKSEYNVAITLQPNTSSEPREAVLDVIRTDNGKSVQKINIVQLGHVATLKVEKLWSKLSGDANWFVAAGGASGADFNIAVDDQNVYVPEFGNSKKLLAFDIATGNTITEVNTSTVESVGFDGSIYLSCARVVKKNDGTPVLLASNLFQDGETATGRLYIWENGIDAAPAVKTLQQWNAGRRLGDTWTTYGNYEDCWLLMSTQAGNKNGIVTFKVPTEGNTSYLISRLAVTTGDFCSYYPFPGDMIHGMFSWRGGDHDDGINYRNRYATISSTEDAIKAEGAHTMTLTNLSQWMANLENNLGSGFNYIEFNGKRYVIWVINSTNAMTFDLVIKEGSTSTAWQDIINTPSATITSNGGFAYRDSNVGGMNTSWKQGTDCAVWNTGDEVYIAVNKCNVGLAVYKMYID